MHEVWERALEACRERSRHGKRSCEVPRFMPGIEGTCPKRPGVKDPALGGIEVEVGDIHMGHPSLYL